MSTFAKDATLAGVGSHWIADEYGGSGSGPGRISKEEVFPRFRAKWRGRECMVTMSADRYAARFDGETRLTDWRTYASEAREYNENANGGRGEELSGTARAALSKLCAPLVLDWLNSEDYAVSRRQALAHMIVRHFQENYNGAARVREAFANVGGELTDEARAAILDALAARDAYDEAMGDNLTAAINNEKETK